MDSIRLLLVPLALAAICLSGAGAVRAREPLVARSIAAPSGSAHRLATGALSSAHRLATGAVSSALAREMPRSSWRGYAVMVYFSKHPVSYNSYGTVFPVHRIAPTLGVATFAIGQLIVGPTPAEARAGYFSELARYPRAPSVCGASGVRITLDHRGASVERGAATLQFCHWMRSPGIGSDARITAQVRATLLQFPTIRRIVILNPDGSCFGDLSGLNVCLRRPI